MEVKFDEFGIYNINVAYLKYLHDNIDTEVYYSVHGYEKKPFLGLVIGIGTYTYFIPFSSCKPKHLKWRNVAPDYYLVYEIVSKNQISENMMCKPLSGNLVAHVMAVLDIKKMIPVPDGLYNKLDFDKISDLKYKDLLEKEYRFCKGVQSGIIDRVTKIYTEQKKSGVIHKFYCNFSALEKACDNYKLTLQISTATLSP